MQFNKKSVSINIFTLLFFASLNYAINVDKAIEIEFAWLTSMVPALPGSIKWNASWFMEPKQVVAKYQFAIQIMRKSSSQMNEFKWLIMALP